jgi:putative membrane protein insertion efficiency factor
MKTPLLLLLRAYKLGVSPFLGQNCRFYPTCSDYAAEAIGRHGAWKGSILAGKRLCKCHPWHPGGLDPVPELAAAPVAVASSSDSSSSTVAAGGCSHS